MKKGSLRSVMLLFIGMAGISGLAIHGSGTNPDPAYSITTVFRQGDNGYHTFRIPAIVMANDGTLLAFAEGRKFSWADHEKNDIVLRRSFDNGNSWSEMTIVQNEGDTAFIWIGNPAPVVDRKTGIVHLVFCRKNKEVFHCSSKDNGATWSERKVIPLPPNVEIPWTWVGTGPGIGIQIEHGKQAGRLVIPAHFKARNKSINQQGNWVIYSDDRGETWLHGLIAYPLEEYHGLAENTVVELINSSHNEDSKLYFLPRNNSRIQFPFHRLEAYSDDGGNSLSSPYMINQQIKTVVAQGSLLRWSAKENGTDRNRILFSGLSRLLDEEMRKSDERKHLAVWSSFDETKTWSQVPKRIWSGYSAYSSMVKTLNKELGILFEAGTDYSFNTKVANRYSEIKFARVNEPWLDMTPTGAFWDFRTTIEMDMLQKIIPDILPGGNARPLRVYGNVSLIQRNEKAAETALHFDGRGKLVLHDAETWTQFDFSEMDNFSIEMLFRVEKDSDNSGTLVSRVNPGKSPSPGWKIDIESDGRIAFFVSDDDAIIKVRSSTPVNDGQWHTLIAERNTESKTLSLFVDDKFSSKETDLTKGSLANRKDLIIGASEDLALDNFIGDLGYIKIMPLLLKH